jgi:Zc3h12a-like Ribonuclease NYN domain
LDGGMVGWHPPYGPLDYGSLPEPDACDLTNDPTLFLVLLSVALAAVFLVLWTRRRKLQSEPTVGETWILIDGSNVMHWQDNLPALAPLTGVILRLTGMGYLPGIVFDANAGWKLQGRYLRDAELAWLLGLEKRQVLVVPKGSQADTYLLETAREFGVRIVTNDRFRDWAEAHPEVLKPGFLIKGGMRDGKVWLQGVEPVGGAL